MEEDYNSWSRKSQMLMNAMPQSVKQYFFGVPVYLLSFVIALHRLREKGVFKSSLEDVEEEEQLPGAPHTGMTFTNPL